MKPATRKCERCGEDRVCKPEGPNGEHVCLVCALELTPGVVVTEDAARNAGEQCAFDAGDGRCALRAGHGGGHVGGLAFYQVHGALPSSKALRNSAERRSAPPGPSSSSSSSNARRRPYVPPRIEESGTFERHRGG